MEDKNTLDDPQQTLADSLTKKNKKRFQHALSCGASPTKPMKWDKDGSEFSVLEQACQTAGCASFITACLENGANVHLPNNYGKYPMHFVVTSMDPNNIRAITDRYWMLNCNVQYEGETPLHMLFEMIDDTNYKNAITCIKLLIKNNASVNILNKSGKTSVAIFVENSRNWKERGENWRSDLLAYCLVNTKLDVDAFKADNLRKNIAEFFPDITLPSRENIKQMCIENPQRALELALERKDILHFKESLRCGADLKGLFMRGTKIYCTMFEKTLKTDGCAEFIRICFKNKAVVDQPNENGKYPIHFVVSSRDPHNVRVLLDSRCPAKLNCDVKYQGKTALHMLFETNNMRQKDWENVFACVKLFIEAGADFNIPDRNDQTPLGVFVKNSKEWQKYKESWRKDVLEYCLTNTNVDVDAYENDQLRKNIKDYFPGVAIPSNKMKVNFSVLEAYLEIKNDEKFDAALRKYKENIDEVGWIRLVKVAVNSGKLSLVQRLMNGEFSFELGSEISDLLASCCNAGYPEILKFLLLKTEKDDGKLINQHPLLCLAIKNINTAKNGECLYFKCLKYLLDDERIDIDKTDENGLSALHYAEEYKVDVAFYELLKKGAYIGTQNKFKELPICERNADILEKYLDECLTAGNKRPGDEEFEININFSCLVPPVCKPKFSGDKNRTTMADEMLPISYMSSSTELKYLLKHPVISSFILIKWLRLSLYFYINFVTCTLFCLSFVWYVVGCYGHDHVDPWLKGTLHFTSLVGTTYLALRETFQLLLHWKMYIRSMENWLEICLIFTSYAVLLKDLDNGWRQVIPALVIMLSAAELTLLVGKLPVLSIATHMVMLKTVSKNFLKSLALYSIILVSFAFCFHTLFTVSRPNDSETSKLPTVDEINSGSEETDINAFADIKLALLKTFVMLTGEFEAANIKFQINSTSYLIFALFLFLVTIVIFNLMNGLAVSDTAAIKAEAEIVGLIQKVDVISSYEDALKTIKSDDHWKQINFEAFLTTHLKLFPEYLPKYCVKVAPNQSNTIYINWSEQGKYNPQATTNCRSLKREETHIEMERLMPNGAAKDSFNQSVTDSDSFTKVKLAIADGFLPSMMDGKIMKRAKQIIHSRNKKGQFLDVATQPLETRLAQLERDMGKILEFMAIMARKEAK